uniref:glycosyltransferase n=1 Tax=Pararhizobium sp. IMCC3301 TaxID=3067904 RepID=UPI0027412ADA|nr:glycosyltransferase [Pararhizobium sp. IMCC3301]
MNPSTFILVSPGAVDGYPPVQYQARLLAEAGHSVTLVTTPRRQEQTRPAFCHPGVAIRCISGRAAFGGRLSRMWQFGWALLAARRAAPQNVIEIAYDPIGLFYSDRIPLRPRRRMAHLHELLQYPESFLEKRLQNAIHSYDAVIVPDTDRAAHTQRMLRLAQSPLVIENYPLRAPKPLVASKEPGSRFEVIYCGSLGLQQKLDTVIRSIPDWPGHANLVLIGNDETRTAIFLRNLVVDLGLQDRVQFLGWMETPEAERRLAQADIGIAIFETDIEQLSTALGASNKRFQYMKAGLPQIGDGNPGIVALIEGNKIGSCVAMDEPTEIAALVCAYSGDHQRCCEEGKRAFALHQSQFNYERVFARLLKQIECW